MPYRSHIQPLCRHCGKPIKKWTHTIFFGSGMSDQTEHSSDRCEKPKTIEEAQTYSKHRIVSIRYLETPNEERYIHRVSTWDGESYETDLFCSGPCTVRFARLMASNGHVTVAYNDAKVAQEAVLSAFEVTR